MMNNRFILFQAISLRFSGKDVKVSAQANPGAETQVKTQHARDCEQSIHWDLPQFGSPQACKNHGEEIGGVNQQPLLFVSPFLTEV
jgi:hypothetical protein